MKSSEIGFIVILVLAALAALILIQALLPIIIAVFLAYILGRFVYLPLGLGVGIFVFVGLQLHSFWPGFIAGAIIFVLAMMVIAKLKNPTGTGPTKSQ